MSYLTSEAKAKLSSTIRTLRERLLTDLQNAAESVYRLSIRSADQAGLAESQREQRRRVETWLDEQVRAESAGQKLSDSKKQEIRERCLLSAQKLAAATLLNRLVVIKQLEAQGVVKPAVVTGGWRSAGYREFREFAPDLCKDESEGYAFLLKLLFDELAMELPGLFGQVGLSALFPVPVSTLRAVVEALDNPALGSAWLDDTTLGWIYQYWNDPEREALDDKLNGGGKVEPHEIASKTQMFTERYMVEWLLHNSLGQIWLAICQQNDWIPEVKADGTLDRLEERRTEWREKRESGAVALDALMPIETELEERWKYWVPQPLAEEAIAHAPKSVRELKILDPACGSGHFLIIAVGLLFALYQEEARHRDEVWSDKEIVESIIENNLYGIDLDPRAVQIAAAALYLKAKTLCADAEMRVVNLVASNLNLAALPKDDPALVELRHEVEAATGIPEELTDQIVKALTGADQWGSLLKVDDAVDRAILQFEEAIKVRIAPRQGDLFGEVKPAQTEIAFDAAKARESLTQTLEDFLNKCTRGDDLGLRLRGEQLAAGVRFIRMIREDSYDLVLGNPPYQGASKMEDAKYLLKHYPRGKADLYAAFLERGLQLAKPGGLSALLTMRNWMFISQYSDIRKFLIEEYDLRALGDLDQAAFEFVTNSEVLAVVMSIFAKNSPTHQKSTAIRWIQLDEQVYNTGRTSRKRAAVLAQARRYEFQCDRFAVIKEKPIIYWWDDEFLKRYAETPKIGDLTEVRQGLATANNTRYLRFPWEVSNLTLDKKIFQELGSENKTLTSWVPYIKGAAGKSWIEPLDSLILWRNSALEKQLDYDYWGTKGGNGTPSRQYYFTPGVAFPKIGQRFLCRAFRYKSVFGDAGSSVFLDDIALATCSMNSRLAQNTLSSLNPSVNFQVGDVIRLPFFRIEAAAEIFAKLEIAFTFHEAAREPSVEFKQPSSSCWVYAQAWAQQTVDREADTPLPEWNPVYEETPAENWVSYAVGVALGRFGANGEGILSPSVGEVDQDILPQGILYLSAYSGDLSDSKDSLQHPASQPINTAWAKRGSSIAKGKPLPNWLRLNFFKDVHVGMYEQRPIYFPLSSAKKNFVAFISIHRWADTTLPDLLADYLAPELSQLEGELADLIEAKSQGDREAQASAEKRYSNLLQLHDELKTFIDLVQQCAEQGPPPANPRDTLRETDAKFKMDLDDGVMINSAALWPLLAPQWAKPKAWWSELCNAQGKKDYDWSHLAARYFPTRIDVKCQQDPSLAVAHGCFWKYHPAKAYEWELRLQDEIALDFTIDETDSDTFRQQFETEHPQTVIELKEKEEKRRERKRKKEDDTDDLGPLFDAEQPEASDD